MSTGRFPVANAEKLGYVTLNERRHIVIDAAEKAGRDLVAAEQDLLRGEKLAKAEAFVEGIKSAAGQASYAADQTIELSGAVGLAEVVSWAAKKHVKLTEDEGDQMESVAATLRKEMDLNSQGGQP